MGKSKWKTQGEVNLWGQISILWVKVENGKSVVTTPPCHAFLLSVDAIGLTNKYNK